MLKYIKINFVKFLEVKFCFEEWIKIFKSYKYKVKKYEYYRIGTHCNLKKYKLLPQTKSNFCNLVWVCLLHVLN